MGTKNDPSEFDCYAAAEPDEPMFVLLARDPLAPALVVEWARRREQAAIDEGGELDPAKTLEARACAQAMRAWRAEHR